jgi:putative hydrolase of the HAD superfamily
LLGYGPADQTIVFTSWITFLNIIMIKTVLFDLGNVILPFDVTRLARRLTSYSPLSAEQIVEKLWNLEIAMDFETGRMSPHEYFDLISKLCGFKNLTFSEFVPIFNEIFDQDHHVVDLIKKLKPNYRLGLISNTNAIHVAHILENYPELHHFEKHWWSNEAGIRKPDPKIYFMALDHFSIEPSEAVFIDDMPENVGSAKNIGIQAILYQGVNLLKNELSKLGVQY